MFLEKNLRFRIVSCPKREFSLMGNSCHFLYEKNSIWDYFYCRITLGNFPQWEIRVNFPGKKASVCYKLCMCVCVRVRACVRACVCVRA